MKIRQLQLKNIGVFDDEEINFQECPTKDKAEIHILTGENGTGKTTILEGITYLFDPNKQGITATRRFREFDKIPSREATNINDSDDKSYQHLDIAVRAEFENGLHSLFGIVKNDQSLGIKRFTNYERGEIEIYEKKLEDPNSVIFDYAIFAFSSYRHIENERVQANYLPKNFNPLSQSLEFIKDYRKEGEITINQLVANNISNRALSKEDGSLEEVKKYETVINSIETFIKDVTDYEVKFVLKRSPNELKLRMHSEELYFDVLPDGLRSLISWIADLLGRVDMLKWNDDLPITEKNLILLLDEIEVHLHPAWQRKVLPVVQKLFKNAQIFVSTHSPFVVNSVDDAWVYELEVKDGNGKVREKSLTKTTESVQTTLEEVFEVPQLFGLEVQNDLDRFYELRSKLNQNGGKSDKEFREIAKRLLKKSEEQNSAELQNIIAFELKQLKYEL